PDLRQRVVALRICGRQPGPLPAAETQRRGLIRQGCEGNALRARTTTAKPRVARHAPAHGSDQRPAVWSRPAPMAAPPAIPTLAVAFVHAPAISGETACVRTAHAW